MNTNSNPPVDDFDYETFIDGFEEVTYWHFAWYSKIMGALLYDQSKILQSHHECRFGKFMDQTPIPPGQTKEFNTVRELHQQMHEAANTLMSSRKIGQKPNESIFKDFSETQGLFTAAFNALLRGAMMSMAEQKCRVWAKENKITPIPAE